ncbi:hypothetical protein JCM10213_008915 [Rhodosporidiobolus nylandii]
MATPSKPTAIAISLNGQVERFDFPHLSFETLVVAAQDRFHTPSTRKLVFEYTAVVPTPPSAKFLSPLSPLSPRSPKKAATPSPASVRIFVNDDDSLDAAVAEAKEAKEELQLAAREERNDRVSQILLGAHPLYSVFTFSNSPPPTFAQVVATAAHNLGDVNGGALYLAEDGRFVRIASEREWKEVGWPRAVAMFWEGRNRGGWKAAAFHVGELKCSSFAPAYPSSDVSCPSTYPTTPKTPITPPDSLPPTPSIASSSFDPLTTKALGGESAVCLPDASSLSAEGSLETKVEVL